MNNTRCMVNFNCEKCIKGDVCPHKSKVAELVENFSDKVCGHPFNASLTCWAYINKSKSTTGLIKGE